MSKNVAEQGYQAQVSVLVVCMFSYVAKQRIFQSPKWIEPPKSHLDSPEILSLTFACTHPAPSEPSDASPPLRQFGLDDFRRVPLLHPALDGSADRLRIRKEFADRPDPPPAQRGQYCYIYIYCTREINSPCWNYFKVLYLKYISGQRVTTDLFQKIFEESSRSITSHGRPELGRVDHRDSPNFTANKGPRELFQRNFTPKKISPSYTWRPAHDFVANAPNSCMDGSQVIGLMLCKISWSWDSCQWCFQKSQHLPHRPHLQSNSFPRIKQHEAASAWRF